MGNNSITTASSWSVASLPKFCERRLAELASEIGLYSSPEEAYHEVSEEKLETINRTSSNYLKQHKRPKSWKVAAVPQKQF